MKKSLVTAVLVGATMVFGATKLYKDYQDNQRIERRIERTKKEETEKIEKHQRYLRDNDLLEGEERMFAKIPGERYERIIVYDKDGNPVGYNEYSDVERQHASESGNPRHYEAYQQNHIRNNLPYNNTKRTYRIEFTSEQKESLRKQYIDKNNKRDE